MTTEEVIAKIEQAISDAFPEASVGKVDGEPAIGVEIDGDYWFVTVEAG